MLLDTDLIIRVTGLVLLCLWLFGTWSLLVASRKARGEFRSKGYLRRPAGSAWIRFLLYRHYDSFENVTTRTFFGLAHFCLIALIVVALSVSIFLGSEFLLRHVANGPGL